MRKPRRKPGMAKPGMARITVLSSDMTQDRYLPIEEARARYEAGELAIDDDSGRYRLNYDPRKTPRPIIPAFLRDAPFAR